MIIKAERMRIEEDTDNNLWLIDFRDEKKGLRGRIEIPSKIVSMEEDKEFEVEIILRKKIKKPINLSIGATIYLASKSCYKNVHQYVHKIPVYRG